MYFVSLLKLCFSKLVVVFRLLISFFTIKIVVVAEEHRSAFNVMTLPFVNWFTNLKESIDLLTKNSLKVNLLNLYKSYLSLLMACLFFIMYVTSFTVVGITFYCMVPVLAICVASFLMDYYSHNIDGDLPDNIYRAMILFRKLTIIFGIIPASSIIISTCAKIEFLRGILIDTIGSLSYKLYVGENSGTKAGLLWKAAPHIIVAATGMMGAVATIDAVSNVYEFKQVAKSCREDLQVMSVGEKIAFFKDRPSILAKVGKFMADYIQASK